MAESRVVQRFAESIKEHDLARMKKESSSDFESKAVKGDETFRALKLIELPEGMPKVTAVKDIKGDDDKEVVMKRVTATVGKNKRKLYFTLIPDGKSGKWVVDDMFLSRDDYENNKSVATRLAVLINMQESLDAWKSGARGQMIAAATPEFGDALGSLTPGQLANFAHKVTVDMADTTKIQTDERIGDETAELVIAKQTADLIMKFRRDGQRWLLDDLAVKSRRPGEDIASARLVTAAMATALKFENAYRSFDKRTLQQVCTTGFFEGSLAAADLKQVRLPGNGPALNDFDVKLDGTRATFVVRAGQEELTLSLKQQPIERLHETPRFLVDEVTIYDLVSSQDKRLSSLFTAQAAMEAFSAALAAGDVETLRLHATHDFNERVWKHATPAHVAQLPTAKLPAVRPQIVETRFKGSLTEILLEQGDTPVTYLLRDEGGRILVDDLLTPASGRPESTKLTAEVLIPIVGFTLALNESKMELVRGNASSDFSRYAWNHFQQAPQFDVNPDRFFKLPLAEISRTEDRGEVVFGSERQGARFQVVKERGQFLVDDVTLVAGPLDDQQIPMKRTIRTRLAEGD
jgi:hypothetical protein